MQCSAVHSIVVRVGIAGQWCSARAAAVTACRPTGAASDANTPRNVVRERAGEDELQLPEVAEQGMAEIDMRVDACVRQTKRAALNVQRPRRGRRDGPSRAKTAGGWCVVSAERSAAPAVNCSTNLVPTGRVAQSAEKSSMKSEPVMRPICSAVQSNLWAVANARCRLVTTSRGLQIGHPGRAQSPVRRGAKWHCRAK